MTPPKLIFGWTGFFILIGIAAFAGDKTAEIDAYLSKCQEYSLFQGSALVAEKGRILLEKGYGTANMEWQMPNAPDTRFRLASVSKQFASMLAMILAEEKKLSLDDAITKYLTDYRKDTGDKVTIYHLMTHTSGLPDFDENFWKMDCRLPFTKDEIVKKYCSGDLEFVPGSKFKYCNTGYYLLGLVLEKAGGESYGDLLKNKIFIPLGMKDTGLERQSMLVEKAAQGHYLGFQGYLKADYIDIDNAFSAGAIYSTVDDLYKWDQALYGDQLIKKKPREKYFTPLLKNYACGWSIGYYLPESGSDSLTVHYHSGNIQGFNTIINRIPEDSITVILLANIGKAPLKEMTQAIFSIIYDKPYESPKKSIIPVLAETVRKKGVVEGITQYHTLKKDSSDYYSFVENELNMLGYLLLQLDLLDQAIEIFKLNIEMFPEAFNPYDSLGEAYMYKGTKDLAIKNYAKSLELNPENVNAVKMLNKIME